MRTRMREARCAALQRMRRGVPQVRRGMPQNGSLTNLTILPPWRRKYRPRPMNSFTILREHLADPEYIHVLINPLPVYGLAIAALALVLALFLRNQRVTIAALALVFVCALSAWPTYHYGEAGYDRVKAMSDAAGEQWLDEHMARGEKLIWAFYVLAGVSAIGVVTVVKWPRRTLVVSVAVLALASATLGIGGYIAYAGGHVRHREFRFEPPPAKHADEEHHHGSASSSATQAASPTPEKQHEHQPRRR
jgi:hypothetical protein